MTGKIRTLYNKITYRRVFCEECGKECGYVWWNGHKRWLCASCALSAWPQPIKEGGTIDGHAG